MTHKAQSRITRGLTEMKGASAGTPSASFSPGMLEFTTACPDATSNTRSCMLPVYALPLACARCAPSEEKTDFSGVVCT